MVLLLQILAVLAVVFGVAVVLTGRAEGLSEEHPDRADTGIPRDRSMTAQDVVGLRFALAFRGYRMSEVDDALDRLAAELAARDELIAELRGPDRTHEPTLSGPEAEVPSYDPMDEPGDLPPIPDPLPSVLAEEPATPPAPEPEPALPAAPAEESPIFGSLTTPLRPEVPEIPAYDPWSVTPRSRYTDGPTYVEVEEHDDSDVAETVIEHQTGYAPAPSEATHGAETAETAGSAGEPEDEAPPRPPWQR